MYQPSQDMPVLGLTLAIPRAYAERAIADKVAKGNDLVSGQPANLEELAELKRKNWSWVLETCDTLKEVFGNEAVSLYFSSSVYLETSVKLDDFERDLDEFVPTVKGRLDRLSSLLKTLPVIPEPPAGQLLNSLLHPRIVAKCWRDFELGNYVQAISASLSEIESYVKDATTGSIGTTGAELMMQAFHPDDGMMSDKAATPADREGLCMMLTGFFSRYQGLASYTQISIEEAARVLTIASHLLFTMEHRPAEFPEVSTYVETVPDEAASAASTADANADGAQS